MTTPNKGNKALKVMWRVEERWAGMGAGIYLWFHKCVLPSLPGEEGAGREWDQLDR